MVINTRNYKTTLKENNILNKKNSNSKLKEEYYISCKMGHENLGLGNWMGKREGICLDGLDWVIIEIIGYFWQWRGNSEVVLTVLEIFWQQFFQLLKKHLEFEHAISFLFK